MNATRDIKRIGVLSIIISIFFLLVFCVCVFFIIMIHRAIEKEDSLIVILLIIIAVAAYAILGGVGIISLILFIANFTTGISVIKNSSSVDKLYEKRRSIKASIIVMRITTVVLIIAGLALILKGVEVINIIVMVICFILAIVSFVLVNKSSATFKELLKLKENNEI